MMVIFDNNMLVDLQEKQIMYKYVKLFDNITIP
jgi:hypothetical protein